MTTTTIDNSILFFKIFRNNYLKYLILGYICPNKYISGKVFFSEYQLHKYKYKEYLRDISLFFTDFIELPKQIVSLELSKSLNSYSGGPTLEIPDDFIPPSVKKLTLSTKIVGLKIPPTVEHLILNFDTQITPDSIPSTIKHLEFGYQYTSALTSDSFSNDSQIESIVFGWDYKSPIQQGTLPSNLKSIKLRYYFNSSLPLHSLPQSLQVLKITIFQQENDPFIGLNNLINLKQLLFAENSKFNQSFKVGELSNKLEILELADYNQSFQVGSLPDSLLELKITGATYYKSIDSFVLPPNLKKLHLGRYNYPLGIKMLPDSLTDLYLDNFNQPLVYPFMLPPKLTKLFLGSTFKSVISCSLPLNLTNMCITGPFNFKFTNNFFPHSLKYLSLPNEYTHTLPQEFPNIIQLKIGKQSVFEYYEHNNKHDHLSLLSLFNE